MKPRVRTKQNILNKSAFIVYANTLIFGDLCDYTPFYPTYTDVLCIMYRLYVQPYLGIITDKASEIFNHKQWVIFRDSYVCIYYYIESLSESTTPNGHSYCYFVLARIQIRYPRFWRLIKERVIGLIQKYSIVFRKSTENFIGE